MLKKILFSENLKDKKTASKLKKRIRGEDNTKALGRNKLDVVWRLVNKGKVL